MNTEIKELENKITTWKNLSMFRDYSKEIAEAEARIEELKQQNNTKSSSRADIDKAFTKVESSKVESKVASKDKVEVEAQKRADTNTASLGENEVEVEDYEEENDTINFDYDILLCTHKPLLDGTTGKQYNSYSQGCVMGRADYKESVSGEMDKFLYAKDIENRRQELISQGVKVPSRRTLEKDFKFLEKLGYVNIINSRENGVCYRFSQSIEGKYFADIPLYKWKELVVSTNRNMLKLFTIISIKCNYEDFTQITHEYLCIAMDIEPTDGNQKYIGTMVNSLRKLGMIKINQKMDVWYDEEKGKKLVTKHNYYRLTTKEEYDLNNRIK